MKNNDYFWNEQAKHGYDVKAVNFDPIKEELELEQLKKMFNDTTETILDMGCGNGRTIIELAIFFPHKLFYGIDKSDAMIDVANKKKNELELGNVCFFVGDATDIKWSNFFKFNFDIVICKRLFINVFKGYKNIFDNVFNLLDDNGVFLLLECFVEPLEAVNKVRKLFGLKKIVQHSFNRYLIRDDFFKEANKFFCIDKVIDFLSFYYFVSRIFNAYLSVGEPDYNSKLNMCCKKLVLNGVSPISGFSPETLICMRKINEPEFLGSEGSLNELFKILN